MVRSAEGLFAARGQVAVVRSAVDGEVREAAVVDQIETCPGHRRRGLGRLVMGLLADAALDAGATTGVLGATDDGRALYAALGWHSHGPLSGAVFDPGEPTPESTATATEPARRSGQRSRDRIGAR